MSSQPGTPPTPGNSVYDNVARLDSVAYPGGEVIQLQDHAAVLEDDSANALERCEYNTCSEVTILDADFSDDGYGVTDFEQHLLFAGYRYDTESGLYEARNRMLHPTLGRWMQRDPLAAQ